MTYHLRAATSADLDSIAVLFPRLASFELTPNRSAEDLWRGDLQLLNDWGAGKVPHCLVLVAVDGEETILGVAMAQLREELLSHMPSAHLEVLVVRDGAEGQGIGQALIHAIEAAVRDRGAQSLTLHVFSTNTRARALYERLGYVSELIRCIKFL